MSEGLATAERESTKIEASTQRVDSAVDAINENCERVGRFIEERFGTMPPEPPIPNKEVELKGANPGGTVGELFNALDRLDRARTRLYDITEKLSAINL